MQESLLALSIERTFSYRLACGRFGSGSGRELVSGNVEKIAVKEHIRCEREKKHSEERERE